MATTNLVLSEEELNSIYFGFKYAVRKGVPYSFVERSWDMLLDFNYHILKEERIYVLLDPFRAGVTFYIPNSIDIDAVSEKLNNGVDFVAATLCPYESQYDSLNVIVALSPKEKANVESAIREKNNCLIDRTYYLPKEEYEIALSSIKKVGNFYRPMSLGKLIRKYGVTPLNK